MAQPQKDYLAIARKKMTRPSEMTPKWRIFVYSRQKKGKTRFLISADEGEAGKILIADSERGTDKYRGAGLNPHVWPINRWEDTQELWGALRTGELSPKTAGLGKSAKPYAWVGIDTMTKIHNYALRYVMGIREEAQLDKKPGLVSKQDHGKAGELSKELVLKLDALPNIGVLWTAQEKIKTLGDNEEEDELDEVSTWTIPELPDGVRSYLNANCDVIGRLYVAKAEFKAPDGGVVEKNQRRMWLGAHPRYDTGYRSEFELPDLLKNPTVPLLVKTMMEGAKSAKKSGK